MRVGTIVAVAASPARRRGRGGRCCEARGSPPFREVRPTLCVFRGRDCRCGRGFRSPPRLLARTGSYPRPLELLERLGSFHLRLAEAGASKRSSTSAAAPSVLELAFPAPSGSLLVPAGLSSPADLVSTLSQATGATYAIDASVKEAFDAAQVSLRKSITLQSAQAYPWSESQLLAQGFGISCDANMRPATVQIRSSKSSASNEADCLWVDAGDLDFVRRHLAMGFTTTLKLV